MCSGFGGDSDELCPRSAARTLIQLGHLQFREPSHYVKFVPDTNVKWVPSTGQENLNIR